MKSLKYGIFMFVIIMLCSCGKSDYSSNSSNTEEPSYSNEITNTEMPKEGKNSNKLPKIKNGVFQIKNGTLVKYLGNYDKEVEIVLPDSVEKIGKEAFAVTKKDKNKKKKVLHLVVGKDVKLTEGSFGKIGPMNIEFEKGRKTIEEYAFGGGVAWDAEVDVIIPDTVKVLEKKSFYNDYSCGILHVNLSEGLERIEEGALYGTGVNKIPDTVRYIGKEAIGVVANVDTVLPAHLETLEQCSIECYGGRVFIPASVKSIAINAVSWLECSNWDEQGYTVAKDNPYYKSDENGWLYSKDGTVLYFAYKLPKENYCITIPKGVKYVYKDGILLYDDDYPENEEVKIIADEQVVFR